MKSLTLFSAFILASALCFGQTKPDSLPSKIDNIFKSFNRTDGPGCAASVISDGKVLYEKGYGMANLEYDIPLTPNSVFDIASVSKQFTGLAISTLIQEGKLSPDDDIHKYLPDVPQFAQKILVRHLIHHTSGLRDWPEALHAAGWRWDEVFSFDDIMRMVKQQKDLDFVPGSKYTYSNTGYNLLAAIVEKITGESLGKWEAEHIFKPLGMGSTHLQENYNQVIKNRAYSYHTDSTTFGTEVGELTAYGSSSIFTSVEDLNKWVINFQNKINAKNPVYLRMLETDFFNDKTKGDYAYGLGVREVDGIKIISHTGGWQGYRTIILNYPDQKLSIIVLSNFADFDTGTYGAKIADIFIKGKSSVEKVKESIGDKPTVTVDTTLMKKYTGSFRLGENWYVTFTLENGQLMVQATNEDKVPTEPKSDSVFWVPAYNAAMNFIKEKNGIVNSLKYKAILAKRALPLKLTVADFPKYAGNYYSTELEAAYRIYVKDGTLYMHNMRLGDLKLTPDLFTPDQFDSDIGTLRFDKNDKQELSGFKLSGGRIRNIRFDKK